MRRVFLGLFWIISGGISICAQASVPALPAYAFSQNEIDVIYDRHVFEELEAVVRTAKRSVRIDFFIFGGPSAERILDVLLQKQKEGVKVKVMLDRRLARFFTTYPERLAFVNRLRAGKIPFTYATQAPILMNVPKKTIDHNKVVVVDEQVAMVGSSNVGSWFYRYHDQMFFLRGPLAQDLARQFDFDWYNSTHLEAVVREQAEISVPIFDQAAEDAKVSWARVTSVGIGRETARAALNQVLDRAQLSIDLQMHEFSDPSLIEKLVRAKKRGVRVRVLLDPWEIGRWLPVLNVLPKGIANVPSTDALLRAGIDVRTFHLGEDYQVAHMKSVVIDGHVLYAGSSNWTFDGFKTVIECNLEVHGGRAPGEALAQFEWDWSDRSDPALAPDSLAWKFYQIYRKVSGASDNLKEFLELIEARGYKS